MKPLIKELIARKRDGGELTADEIAALIDPAADEAQLAAFLMAVVLRGMSEAETGALLEAHRDQRAVTAVACVSRLSAADRMLIATPCGICQERLYHWGYGVEVAGAAR